MNYLTERRVRLIFEISLFVKGAFALIEMIGGAAAFVIPRGFVLHLISTLSQNELAEDPHDLVANYLLHSAQHLSISTQYFAAIYLLSHGAIKLWLIVGLLRERLWYYPTAMIVFGLFIIYQLYRFGLTQSAFLLVLTAVDVFVIALTWHEYRFMHRHLQQGDK
jgi:uncharacterized membrane protein